MPLSQEILGTNADGSKNEDYCVYCYKDGKFTQDCTMDEMIEFCAQFVDEVNKNMPKPMTKDEYKDMMRQYFPMLIRWRQAKCAMQTERILLRPWRESDAEALFKYASDPDVGPRAGWPPHRDVKASLEIIRTVFNNDSNWAIELKATGEAIGAIGYGPACDCKLPAREGETLVGYWVGKPYWNQGICTEALQLMLDHIRMTKDFPSLISGHFVDNPVSGRVMEKCGFVPTGETCIDESQYQGKDRPIRVLRLVL